MPTPEHEEGIRAKAKELTDQGWRVFILKKHPDAIAVKDGRVVAVEVLTYHRRKDGKVRYGNHTISQNGKRLQYRDFDDVFIALVERRPQRHELGFRKAAEILDGELG